MDETKQVRQFADNTTMLKAYEEFVKFVNDNRDNWEYLPSSSMADVEGLRAIITEKWPIDKMRHYKQMKQSLGKALEEVRQALRKRIEDKLTAQDAEVAAHAAANKVEYVSNVRAAITRATISSNIAVLQANELSNDWFTAEISRINAEVARRNPPKSKPNTGGGDETKPTSRVVPFRLQTPSLSNIKNADDLEAYLNRLRKQITNKLANLNSGDDIQVL